jgi:hypothetical protein
VDVITEQCTVSFHSHDDDSCFNESSFSRIVFIFDGDNAFSLVWW